MCAERGETGAVSRVKQYDADNRIFAAERTIICENREAFGLQLIDRFYYARIPRHHLRRDLRQADALGDNAVLNMAFKHFRKPLNAGFVAGVARGHPVRNVQVADDIHRNIDRFTIRLTGERQATDAALVITRLQIHQHAGG